MNQTWERYAQLGARILISSIFLFSGIGKIMNWSGTAAMMASKGLPAVQILLPLAVLFELGGAILVLIGYRARLGALALFLFLIPTTFVFHDFWAVPAAEQGNQIAHFMKNVVIMGALLKVMGDGAGAFSVDAARTRLVVSSTRLKPGERQAA